MKPFPFLVVLALGLSAVFSGCATSIKPDSITVTVAGLKSRETSAQETRLVATLRFTSESLNAFGFSSSSHKLYLNGTYVGRAVGNTPIGLPPLSTTTQDIALTLENTALVRQLASSPNAAAVKYHLESVLFTTAGEDEMKVKGSTEGMVDLRGIKFGTP